MTSKHSIKGLRVDVPTLEPDPVLLTQLVRLSSANAPAATTSRASSVKVLLAAVGVAAVTATTWAAGAVPGVPSPIRPAHHPHTAVSPSPSPTSGPATRTPGASDPTSEAPGSIHPTPDSRPHSAAPGASPTIQGPGTRRKHEHTGAHLGPKHHHQSLWPVAPSAPNGLHPQHPTASFGSRFWQHDHHGTGDDRSPGYDPGTEHPGSTPKSVRSPDASPTNGSSSPDGGQETSPP